MSNRYNNTQKYKNKENKKLTYKTTLYNKIPESNGDLYFIAQHGDRFDNLAQRFYGDSSLWWFLARTNHLKSMNIPAGTKLRIPPKML